MFNSRSTTFVPGHDMTGPHGSSGMAMAALANSFSRSTLTVVWHALDWIADTMDRARQRYELASLDDRLLKDIGLTRYDAMVEFRKPFWR